MAADTQQRVTHARNSFTAVLSMTVMWVPLSTDCQLECRRNNRSGQWNGYP